VHSTQRGNVPIISSTHSYLAMKRF
jgi:hypothetical protein